MSTMERILNRSAIVGERTTTQKKAQELCALLTIWSSCYPVIYTRRAAQVSNLVVTALPDLPMPYLLLVGKIILFVYAVHSLTDERIIPYAEFLRVGEGWDLVARGGKDIIPEPGDDLGVVLSGIRTELNDLPLYPTLRDLWGRRLWALLLAVAQDYLDGLNCKARGADAMPKLDEYMLGGIHSGGFPFWGTTSLILFNEPELLERSDIVNEVILQTGAAMRLYTDVTTYEKEVQEGNMNAVAIVHHDLINSSLNRSSPERLEHAKEIVLHLADQYAQKCLDMVDQPFSKTGRFEQMIRRTLNFQATITGSFRAHHLSQAISTVDTRTFVSSR